MSYIYHIHKWLLLTVMFMPLFSLAQNKLDCNVVSFSIDPFSTTAQDRRFEKIDGNGERYAIIKVKDADEATDLSGFTFNFGALNSYTVQHEDELWVYVQRNAKTVTIKHHNYKTIEKYDLNTTIQPGKTYIMLLTMSHIEKTIVHGVRKQVLQFKILPANEGAIVKVKKANSSDNYELWGETDNAGTIDRMLDFGTYDYIVSAPNYTSSSGRIMLTDSQNNHVENVTLTPNFGFLSVTSGNGVTGAQIFVDDVKIGVVPYNDPYKRWECGTHNITINNGELYKPFTQTFTIRQGETTVITPVLESDFAQTTIVADTESEIFIDKQSKGTGTWTGPLKAGQYIVTCSKLRHRDSEMVITVRSDQAETYRIPSPTPITGSIYISSTPSGAAIDVDGESKGVTPTLLQDIIIGQHTISLSLPNHKTEHYDVTVKESETHDINAKLSDITNMTISSIPSNAEIIVEGKSVGYTPYTAEMSSGDYNIMLKKSKYQSFKGMVHLDSSNPQKQIKLSRQYQQPYSFYIQPTLQVGSSTAVGGAIGAYIANVNIEGYYLVGLDKSEEIWWNSTATDPLKPVAEVFDFSTFGAKLGYGIIISSRLRVTPLLDISLISINGNQNTKCNVLKTAVGCKADYILCNHVSLNLTPEYGFPIKKSSIYSVLEPVSNKIKAVGNGFNCSFGLCFSF